MMRIGALVRSWRMSSFDTLPLKPALLASVATLGYDRMTPVQAQSLPPMLARSRRDRAGADRQRQDRRVRAEPAAEAGCRHDPPAGAGAVPHARAGRPGEQGDPQAGGQHSQREAADPVRRHAAGPAAGVAHARSAHRGRHARPRAGASQARQPARRRHPGAGAGRGRPHARHGLYRGDRRHRRAHRQAPSDPAVLGHLSG